MILLQNQRLTMMTAFLLWVLFHWVDVEARNLKPLGNQKQSLKEMMVEMMLEGTMGDDHYITDTNMVCKQYEGYRICPRKEYCTESDPENPTLIIDKVCSSAKTH